MAKWPDLKRGDLVIATDKIPAEVAPVPLGTLGVCFQPAEYHGPNTGPMVRFANGCACNVYEDWVLVAPAEAVQEKE